MGLIELGVVVGMGYSLYNSFKDDIAKKATDVKKWLVAEERKLKHNWENLQAPEQKKPDNIGDKCRVNFIWRWADKRNWNSRQYDDYKPYFIDQSCSAYGNSFVPTAIWQGSGNGVADDHPLWPDMNGGLNPIVSERSLSYLNNGQQGSFTASEMWGLKTLLSSNGLAHTPKNIKSALRTLKSVGFMRLSEYHWIASMAYAFSLIDNCGEHVTVQFHCASETNKWYDKEWLRRLHMATGKYFSARTRADSSILKDYLGEPIEWSPILCGADAFGAAVWSIPLSCGEKRTFKREDLKEIKQGPCRNLFPKVTTEFKKRDAWKSTRKTLYGPNSLPRKAE